MTRNTDNYASVLLDTLLVSFLDLVGNSNGIAAVECREFLACGKCLFSDLHQICHFCDCFNVVG